MNNQTMNIRSHLKLLGLSLLSAALFIISWQPYSIIIALLGAFIPLLFIEKEIRTQQYATGWLFLYAFITFLPGISGVRIGFGMPPLKVLMLLLSSIPY
jgi:apolipoprotein N-acyltransferase